MALEKFDRPKSNKPKQYLNYINDHENIINDIENSRANVHSENAVDKSQKYVNRCNGLIFITFYNFSYLQFILNEILEVD
jgi:hypothetical protein